MQAAASNYFWIERMRGCLNSEAGWAAWKATQAECVSGGREDREGE